MGKLEASANPSLHGEALCPTGTEGAEGRQSGFFSGDLKHKEVRADAWPAQGSTGWC